MDPNEAYNQSFAQSRELNLYAEEAKNPYTEKQICSLKTEKEDLETQLKNKDDEVQRLALDIETCNKSIHDKERAQKQSSREITHLEGNLRVNKTKLQEIIE